VPVVHGVQFDRDAARGFEPIPAVAPGEAEQPQAATVAVLGMAVTLEHHGGEGAGVGADGPAPVYEPLRRPLLVRAVRRGHVRVDRREATAPIAAGVHAHDQAVLAPVELEGVAEFEAHRHRGASGADLALLVAPGREYSRSVACSGLRSRACGST
jgi:hypothetical protein